MKERTRLELEKAATERSDAMNPGKLPEGTPAGYAAAIDNAQTGALALRDLISENRLDTGDRLELQQYLAGSLALHESLMGKVTDPVRLLELYADAFSGWAGAKLGQF